MDWSDSFARTMCSWKFSYCLLRARISRSSSFRAELSLNGIRRLVSSSEGSSIEKVKFVGSGLLSLNVLAGSPDWRGVLSTSALGGSVSDLIFVDLGCDPTNCGSKSFALNADSNGSITGPASGSETGAPDTASETVWGGVASKRSFVYSLCQTFVSQRV